MEERSDVTVPVPRVVIPTGQLTPSKDRGSENTVVAVIATQLLRAQQKKLQTDQYFTRGSRDARVSDESVRELTKTLRESSTSEMEVIKAKTASLDEGLKSKQAQLKVLEEKSEESRKLDLAAMIAKERYLQYVSKEEEARLENLKRSDRLINVSVVAKPFIPGSPAFPKTFLFVLGAFFLAFPLGIGTILVLNFFEHSFNHPKEVEAGEFMVEAWPALIIGSLVLALLTFFGVTRWLDLLARPLTWVLGLPAATGVPLAFGILRKELSLVMLGQALGTLDFAAAMSPVRLFTYTVFVVFYIPCTATLMVLRRELGARGMLSITGITLVVALAAALVGRGLAMLVL